MWPWRSLPCSRWDASRKSPRDRAPRRSHRTRVLARSALAHMREDGEARPPSEIEVQLTMRKPTATPRAALTLQDLLNESAPLDEVAGHLRHCPAVLPREFACHPASSTRSRARRGVVDGAPSNDARCTAGALLVRGLASSAGTASPEKLRASGTNILREPCPVWRAGRATTGRVEISSDQLRYR